MTAHPVSKRFGTARYRVREAIFRGPLGQIEQVRRRYPTVHTDQPENPSPLDEFPMFGIVGAWHEADIIGACVANAFEQGCDDVFIVDNDSPDATVDAAVEAGAQLISTFSSPFYDEGLRIHAMESATRFVTARSAADHVWWLWLDADEFPRGPGGESIRSYLARLDRRFRLVGARYFEHFPVGPVDTNVNHRPFEEMPMCVENTMGFCFLGHRKHPLVRHDRDEPFLEMGPGFHRLATARGVLEPTTPITVHHFPYRCKGVSRARLELLCGRADGAADRILEHEALELGKESNSSRRLREFDAVYDGAWDEVEYVRRFGPLVDHRTIS